MLTEMLEKLRKIYRTWLPRSFREKFALGRRASKFVGKIEGRDYLKINRKGIKRDKKIYVVRRFDRVGLFSYFITALGGIAYAVEHDMIPVVDLRSVGNTYVDANNGGGGG